MNQFEFPDEAACRSVLSKLGIDQNQIHQFGQDYEYILADEKRLSDYISLYGANDTSDLEKRILGCFIIQSIEEKLPDKIASEEVRSHLCLLAKDRCIHQSELEYWSVNEESNEEYVFQITKYVREQLGR